MKNARLTTNVHRKLYTIWGFTSWFGEKKPCMYDMGSIYTLPPITKWHLIMCTLFVHVYSESSITLQLHIVFNIVPNFFCNHWRKLWKVIMGRLTILHGEIMMIWMSISGQNRTLIPSLFISFQCSYSFKKVIDYYLPAGLMIVSR